MWKSVGAGDAGIMTYTLGTHRAVIVVKRDTARAWYERRCGNDWNIASNIMHQPIWRLDELSRQMEAEVDRREVEEGGANVG